MSQTKEMTFRNNRFLIEMEPVFYPQHPSWFSFVDEGQVRDDKWLIEPGDCVFDVGAAYGSYTLTALACGAAMTFAWSPQGPPGERTEADYLRGSLRLNEWEDRCMIVESGIYSRPGWLNTMSQDFHEQRPEGTNPDIIRVSPLDEWYAEVFRSLYSAGQFPRYWLKLDVEGAEVEVLRSAERMIADLRPTILVENHNFKRPTIEAEVRELLTGPGRYEHINTAPHHAVSHSLYRPVG